MKYLVKIHNSVGDVAIDISILNAIARLDPECHLEVLAKPPTSNLLEETPFIDKLHVRPHSFFEDLGMQTSLLDNDWDVVLVTRKAAYLQLFYHFAKAKHKRCRRYMDFPEGKTAMEFYVSMLDGILPGWEEPIDTKIHFNTKRRDDIVKKLGVSENARLLTIQPGASNFVKMWHQDKFVSLIKGISGVFDRTLILGSDSERELCEHIAKKTGATNLAGQTELLDVYALMTIVTLHVGNDSGLGHLAASAGTNCLAIGGKKQYTPWQQHLLVGDVKQISLEEALDFLHDKKLIQFD